MSTINESHQIDQEYVPFKPFSVWQGVEVQLSRWSEMRSRIDSFRSADPLVLERAQRIARRAAAVESGAIEDLYKTNRGVTMTIATEAAQWEAAINGTGQPEIVRDQLDAYEGLLDLATGQSPFTEAGIRELHSRLCKSQSTYLVQTQVGPQKHKLDHGKYKVNPNHVRKADGTNHAYAPVDMVGSEMHRLIQELQSDAFKSANGVLQAAYAHHAFVCIHPFPDGNGRVSRAVASVFLYRDAKIPFLFFFDQRSRYYEALSAADRGNLMPWVEFVLEAGLQTMLLVEQTFTSAKSPDATESLKIIQDLYMTKSGLTHEEIDKGAQRLLQAIVAEGTSQLVNLLGGSRIIEGQFSQAHGPSIKIPPGYRQLLTGPAILHLHVTNSKPPANAQHAFGAYLLVPKNPASGDSILLVQPPGEDPFRFEVRIDEVIPTITTSVEVRIRALVDGLINAVMAKLVEKAKSRAEKF